jgi:hypothetical protein
MIGNDGNEAPSFSHPDGTCGHVHWWPCASTVETPGYCRLSLRDVGEAYGNYALQKSACPLSSIHASKGQRENKRARRESVVVQLSTLGHFDMLRISILFATGSGGIKNYSNLPDWLPDWVGFIIVPLAVVGIWYAWRKKADEDDNDEDDNNDDDKKDE